MPGNKKDAELVVRTARTVYVSLMLPPRPEWEIWSNEDAVLLLGDEDEPFWTVYYQSALDIARMVPYNPDVGHYVEDPPAIPPAVYSPSIAKGGATMDHQQNQNESCLSIITPLVFVSLAATICSDNPFLWGIIFIVSVLLWFTTVGCYIIRDIFRWILSRRKRTSSLPH